MTQKEYCDSLILLPMALDSLDRFMHAFIAFYQPTRPPTRYCGENMTSNRASPRNSLIHIYDPRIYETLKVYEK